jgi:hypothetical protein
MTALANEIGRRQQLLTEASAVAGELPKVDEALTAAFRDAAAAPGGLPGLAEVVKQLTALAETVKDPASAAAAVTSGVRLWWSAAQAVRKLEGPELPPVHDPGSLPEVHGWTPTPLALAFARLRTLFELQVRVLETEYAWGRGPGPIVFPPGPGGVGVGPGGGRPGQGGGAGPGPVVGPGGGDGGGVGPGGGGIRPGGGSLAVPNAVPGDAGARQAQPPTAGAAAQAVGRGLGPAEHPGGQPGGGLGEGPAGGPIGGHGGEAGHGGGSGGGPGGEGGHGGGVGGGPGGEGGRGGGGGGPEREDPRVPPQWAHDSGPAFGDPILEALELIGSLGVNELVPPLPAREDVAAVVAWVRLMGETLSKLIGTPAGGSGPVAALLPRANGTVGRVHDGLASAQRVAAALAPGAPAVSTAGLEACLADLQALALTAYTGELSSRPRYDERMADLRAAYELLLAATPPGVGTSEPLVMLPVRLETRLAATAAGATEVRIRVHPDTVHADAHDPNLTKDELEWSALLKQALPGGGESAQQTWALACERFGPARAAYLLHTTVTQATRATMWERAAYARCLPDRWLAVAYDDAGSVLGAALSKPVSSPLQIGPDPKLPPKPGGGRTEPGLRWLTSFQTAVANGMGLTLTLDQAASGHYPAAGAALVPGLSTPTRLVVVGVRSADAKADLSELIEAHRYTDELELLAPDTPTNNTPDVKAGYDSRDAGHRASFAREVTAALDRPTPSGDAARLAGALGLGATLFAGAQAQTLTDGQDQQAILALTFPGGLAYFLTQLLRVANSAVAKLGPWHEAWLRPGGPLPTMRLGTQPYGVLPAVALRLWSSPADPVATHVQAVVATLLPRWLSAYAGVVQRADFDSWLERDAVARDARARLSAEAVTDWLANPDAGLLKVTPELIAHRIAELPAELAAFGSALGPPITPPAQFLTLPDPRSGQATPQGEPWQLGVPFTSGDEADKEYLERLGPASAPEGGSLLTRLAQAAWNQTTAGASGAGFVARGNLGDAAEPPAAASQSDAVRGAVQHLTASGGDRQRLLGLALDAGSHRLEAWATALATSRLGELRAAASPPATIHVGGFGWVENLEPRPLLRPPSEPAAGEPTALADPENAGYMHTPSLQQATTAAVLRSGFLTHNPRQAGGSPPGPDAPFAVDLSSRRARLASWLLDGVRQGQPLAALLGYRFERTLQEQAQAHLIDRFREYFPLDPAAETNGTVATETVRVTDVVDGIALLAAYRAKTLPSPLAGAEAQPALESIDEAADAIGDATLAQGLHDALMGNTTRAAATIDAIARGAVAPPELSFLDTPRTGKSVTHRLFVTLGGAADPPPAPWSPGPRDQAEPALSSWIASLLGNPAAANATVALTDGEGQPLPGADAAVPVTLADLRLGPLDVLALAERPAELEQLAVHHVIESRTAAQTPAAGGHLDDSPPSPTGHPLAHAMDILRAASRMCSHARPADAGDMAMPDSATAPLAELAELSRRTKGAEEALDAVAVALKGALPNDSEPGSPQPSPAAAQAGGDPGTLTQALMQAFYVGVAGAVPVGTSASDTVALVGQARAARAEIYRRQSAIAAAAPSATATEATALKARLAQLEIAFGGGFYALPQFEPTPADELLRAGEQTFVDRGEPGLAPDAWLARAARVHAPIADLLELYDRAEALGSAAREDLNVVQLPRASALTQWAGQGHVRGAAAPPNALSLLLLGGPVPTGPTSALVISDWTEVVPSAAETTAVAYHFDAPTTQPPQTLLVAVPPDRSQASWSYRAVAETVYSTIDLAHARSVDRGDLPAPFDLILPSCYLPNGPNGTPTGIKVNKPRDYLEPEAAKITGVQSGEGFNASANPVQAIQGETGWITVTGEDLNYATFDFTGGSPEDVAILGEDRKTPTEVRLHIKVAENAVPEPPIRMLNAGADSFQALSLDWRRQVTGVTPGTIAQQAYPQTRYAITLHGHKLMNSPASAALVTPGIQVRPPPVGTFELEVSLEPVAGIEQEGAPTWTDSAVTFHVKVAAAPRPRGPINLPPKVVVEPGKWNPVPHFETMYVDAKWTWTGSPGFVKTDKYAISVETLSWRWGT